MATKVKKENRETVVNQLVVLPTPLKSVDVGYWRDALRSAENGRVKRLYDLYKDILIDGVLSDAVSKRIDAITNTELHVVDDDGEIVQEVAELMDTNDFEVLLHNIMLCKMYGRSGVEITFNDGFKVAPIPPKHISLKNKSILINENDERGISYEGDPHLIILGKDKDFGLLLKTAPLAIYKRGGFGDWAEWIEIFGMPDRIGKYDTYDPQSRQVLIEAMKDAGARKNLIVPKGTEIETHDHGSTSGTSYNDFRIACNEEMLITVLGQTLTTVQGSNGARALGEVHQDVEEGKHKADLRFVQRILNQHLVPLLEARGYPSCKFVFPKSAEALSVTDIIGLSEIMDIPQSYLHEKYSIPVAKDGEEIAKRATASVPQYDINEEGEEIKNSDRNIFLRLFDFFANAPLTRGANSNSTLQRITLADNATAVDKLITGVYNGDVKHFDRALFNGYSNDFLTALKRGLNEVKKDIKNSDIGITYNAQDDAFIVALEQNLYRFSASKTLAQVQEMNKALRSAKSYDDFARSAQSICGNFNDTWQRTEYDTAILSASNASTYHRLKSKTDLFPYWKYTTVGDGEVRLEHKALDGLILRADDPEWKKIYPPNGWNCRCRVVGVMKHEVSNYDRDSEVQRLRMYYDTKDWRSAVTSGWGKNRGEQQAIFDENQMYVKHFSKKEVALMNRVAVSDWGLKSLQELKKNATQELPTYNYVANAGTAKDYAGRTWNVTNKTIKKSGNYANNIKDILSSPDEVWLCSNGGKKLSTWLMVKYYNGVAMACTAELKNNELVVISCIELTNEKLRSGILIHSKS